MTAFIMARRTKTAVWLPTAAAGNSCIVYNCVSTTLLYNYGFFRRNNAVSPRASGQNAPRGYRRRRAYHRVFLPRYSPPALHRHIVGLRCAAPADLGGHSTGHSLFSNSIICAPPCLLVGPMHGHSGLLSDHIYGLLRATGRRARGSIYTGRLCVYPKLTHSFLSRRRRQ